MEEDDEENEMERDPNDTGKSNEIQILKIYKK